MIITKNLQISVKSSRDITYLKSIGFKSKIGEDIVIPIEKLSFGSHRLIQVKCCNCKNIKEVRYQAYNKTTNNNKEKYYCNHKDCINKKREKSNKQKYGIKNVFELENVKDKIIKTNFKRYGVKNPQQNKEIKQKTIETIKLKYGVENVFQSKNIKEKIKKTMIKKYGVEYPQQSKLIRSRSSSHKSSSLEIELFNFVNKNNDNNIRSSRKIIIGLELDIYLPDLKLAFEFNGLYWHNELFKDKNYHLNKTELCESKGIQLIHIWEDDWIYKQDIVKSMILNKLGKTPNKIYGRKTIIKEITDNKIVREFLIKNHLQGFIGSKVKLGLFFENELVSLMTFGKRRVAMGKKSTNDGEYELLRFCNKLNTNVLGGASKLFKYFINNYNIEEIITYADRSYSNGNLYKQLGFKYNGKTLPNYYYIINRKREYRFKFRKSNLIKEGYSSNKTEHQIMVDRNIYRIYNSGNLKFIYRNET